MPGFSCPYVDMTCPSSMPVSTEMQCPSTDQGHWNPHQAFSGCCIRHKRLRWEIRKTQTLPFWRSQLVRELVMKTNSEVNSWTNQAFSEHRGGNNHFCPDNQERVSEVSWVETGMQISIYYIKTSGKGLPDRKDSMSKGTEAGKSKGNVNRVGGWKGSWNEILTNFELQSRGHLWSPGKSQRRQSRVLRGGTARCRQFIHRPYPHLRSSCQLISPSRWSLSLEYSFPSSMEHFLQISNAAQCQCW